MKDENHISFSGDGSGVVHLKVGDAPSVLLFRADEPGMREYRLGNVSKPEGQRTSDLIKFSGVTRLRVIVDRADGTGCDEDVADFNHCEDCELIVNDLWPAKKYCCTYKGGSRGIRAVIARQHGHGGETDYDFGNFADQGNGRTTGCSLNVFTVDRTPVAVRLLSADAPALENTGPAYDHPQAYRITRLNQGWFYPLFNWLKDLLRQLGLAI